MNPCLDMSAREFDEQYQATPVWNTGRPQKAYVDRFTITPPQSPVLDIGCGSGDLAIFVAGLGVFLWLFRRGLFLAEDLAEQRTPAQGNDKAI
jgi:2-polyprenyl-3-methyl-5-hydroxy-6-metoxy-1,4-benzoquinol methylase